MAHTFRVTILLALLVGALATLPARGQEGDGIHRLALQISESDLDKMSSVLDVAANVSRHFSGLGEEVEIEVVAFNAGVHMLRADTSPVRGRLESFMQSMVNVSFQVCGNTLDTMERLEGTPPPLIEGTGVVQTGVARLLELHEQGYAIVRP